ncbi:TetR/AcrR family transcriptional regulator [Kribbella sandramycini]|uniref:AcrR family transcriptional regulator n=1 Tax=Kribbella sandramycini TaxID=60450 RepID=A0A7Y4P0S6_9ACTN|nr:TetR/AcrR family transcriptional regulator [Kribbella sandramycini]MBB6566373.1 AcrR family transcriptional regulator [Kribbella sandramycini]NOL42966.1 TetR/AcrR family transcriptional regulator [Kribbella sandramycini]
MVTSGAYPLRRTPTQDRANRQVERILDAACAEVVERGYDGASTSGIAKRAEIAVGSVYRYFPDKRSLIQAIERRNQARYTETVRSRLADVASWRAAVDITMATFREMHRTDPGFRAVVLSGLGDPDLETQPGEYDDQHAAEFAELLTERFGAQDNRNFRLAVTTSIAMGEALAHLADRLSEAEAEYVLAQGLPAIYSLLAPYFPV